MPFDTEELAGAAGVDPWALHAQLAAGDPAAVESLAAQFYRAAGEVAGAELAETHAVRNVEAGYAVGGAPVVDAATQVRQARAHLVDAHQGLVAIGSALVGVGDELATARGTADRLVRSLATELAAVDRDWLGALATVGHGRLSTAERQTAYDECFRRAVALVRRGGADVSACVDTYQAQLTRALRTLAGLGYVPPSALDAAPAPVPAAGTSPPAVAAWWRSLTAAERSALVTGDGARLGRLQGLPSTVLDTVNRRGLIEHLASVDAELSLLSADPSLDPLGTRRAQLRAEQAADDGILTALTSTAAEVTAPVLLLRYSPDAGDGDGGAAIALGDPDRAANTAVVVPGTGSRPAHLSDLTVSKGVPLFEQMASASKSVIVWIDGPEPRTILPDAAFDSAAARSAPRLTADLAGLDAAHRSATGNRGHVTALGHSYGTYILGRALTAGAYRYVDDVIFTGSPGVGVDHAADLYVHPDHVWSGQSGDDPILVVKNRFTPGLVGDNPEESAFGARHFDVTGSHGHGEYFQGRSLANIAHIADGDPSAVHTVPAPDYRGEREILTDGLDGAALDPLHTSTALGSDLLHGDPGHVGRDYVVGAMHEARDAEHLGSDLLVTGEDGVQVAIVGGRAVVTEVLSWF